MIPRQRGRMIVIKKQFRIAMRGKIVIADKTAAHSPSFAQQSWFVVSRRGRDGEVVEVTHRGNTLDEASNSAAALVSGDTLVGRYSVSAADSDILYFQLSQSLPSGEGCAGCFLPSYGTLSLFEFDGVPAILGWGKSVEHSMRLVNHPISGDCSASSASEVFWSIHAVYERWEHEIILK